MNAGTDWERRYAEHDTPWDKGRAHPVLESDMAQGVLSGRVLVPGCGAGHDVRALARCGLDVVGLDVAAGAIQLARSFPTAGKETYHHGNLFDLPENWQGAFDGVFEHTCFCALEPDRRTDYVRSVASVLKPDGCLFAVFYRDTGEPDGKPPFGTTVEELNELFAGHFRVRKEYRDAPTYPERQGCELVRVLKKI